MSEQIRGNIADFWHKSSDGAEQTYDAVPIKIYKCASCRIALDVSRWPSRCAKGHLNVRPE